MPFLSDITHRLLAGRNLSQINSGISRQRTYGNPYGIGGPADQNPDLPPEAYPHGIAPPGYQTSIAPAGGPAYGPTDISFYPPGYEGDSSLPPAAQGVAPGPAYSSLPLSMGSPDYPFTNASASNQIVPGGIDITGADDPIPTILPVHVVGAPVLGQGQPPLPPQSMTDDNLQPIGYTPGGSGRPEFGGPGFGGFAQAQNNFIPGLIAWNGPGQANIADTEAGLGADRYGMGGALAAKFGLMGVQGGGVDFRKHIK